MKKVMIYGAGVSGKNAKTLFEKMQYEVVVVDDKFAMPSTEAEKYLDDIDLFIKSPGIPYNKFINKVKKHKIKIINEIEAAYLYMKSTSKSKIIAITGTNGKTTTASKLSELMNIAGIKSIAAGNIGLSYSEVVLSKEHQEYIVLELSSYQLENLSKFRADIAFIINLTPDHMDRYKDKNEYYDVKFNIGMNQDKNNLFIVNIDSNEIVKRLSRINSNILNVSLEKKTDVYIDNNRLFFENSLLTETTNFSLKGVHNLQNILFITAVAKSIGIKNEIIVNFFKTTKTLEHRMEEFYTYKKINFINDSKGTNIMSTTSAIEVLKPQILICGGCDKQLDLTPLILTIKKNVNEIYLIGEIADALNRDLLLIKFPEKNIHNLGTLEKVVKSICLDIKTGEKKGPSTVLLSPSASSFDQFKNYEERGKLFKKMIKKELE